MNHLKHSVPVGLLGITCTWAACLLLHTPWHAPLPTTHARMPACFCRASWVCAPPPGNRAHPRYSQAYYHAHGMETQGPFKVRVCVCMWGGWGGVHGLPGPLQRVGGGGRMDSQDLFKVGWRLVCVVV